MKYTKDQLKNMNINVSCVVDQGTFAPMIVANGPNNTSIIHKAKRFELEDLKNDVFDKVVDMLIIKLRKEKLKALNEI